MKITHTEPRGSKLGSGKGINVPDTRLDVPALTAKDLLDLGAVVELADVVELAFVREPPTSCGCCRSSTALATIGWESC